MKKSISILMLLSLSACTAFLPSRIVMKNAKGETAICNDDNTERFSGGFGLIGGAIGGSIKEDNEKKCIELHERLGYKRVQ